MRQISKLVGLMVLLVLLSTSVINAQEPIQVGDTIVSSLNGTAARYTVTLEAGEVVIISLSSENFDSLLVINDAMGIQVGLDDDGGDGFNARLAFAAPASGAYTIHAGSYTPEVNGEYTLSITSPAQLVYDTPSTIELSGSNTHYFTFTALKDEVINILANSGDAQLDTHLILKSAKGEELRRNEDDGPANDPAILRFLIPIDGTYTIELKPTFDAELFGTVDLIIEPTELALLGADSRTFTLGDVYNYEILHVETIEGQHYRFIVSKDTARTNMSVNINGSTTLNTFNAIGGTVDFIAEDDLTDIEIRDSGYEGPVAYTVAIEAITD